ncbi:MAG: peroxiredoxin [Gammaproteobacteria bacterium]|nr:peroxiredoxin [Gammaproteobacteria bacterium]
MLLGASVDSIQAHRAWIEHGLGKVSFPLIGDVTRRLAQTFGVLLQDEGVAARATLSSIPKAGSRASRPMPRLSAAARPRRCGSSRPLRRAGSPPSNDGLLVPA